MSLLRRALVNVPSSSLLYFLGMAIAWLLKGPEPALIKALLAGPFLALLAVPFFLAMHGLAAGLGMAANRLGMPARPVAAIAAALVAYVFSGGPVPDIFGDPATARLVFVAAVTLPWLFENAFWWPQRRRG